MLMSLRLTSTSERSDLALQHHQNTASDLSSLPTRQELLSSTSQTVDETRAAERSVDSRINRAEAALLLRLDSLEQRARKTSDNVAKTHDIQDLRAYIDDRLASARTTPDTVASARVTLTLTIPDLRLSKQDVALLFGRLSNEVEAVRQALSIWTRTMLAFVVLVVPQLLLLQRTLRRLPAAISLVLHDNMTFEDALGRFHSLQFQQFRHWRVFESSLHCIFAESPGSRKISMGHFILTPEDQPAVALTAANYSALVRPGYVFKMSMAMKKLTAQASRCPKGCAGNVERVSVLERRCMTCKLQYFTGVLGENAKLEPQKTGVRIQSPGADLSEYRISKMADSARSATKVKADETPTLDPLNSALVRWMPPAYDPRDLIDGWERADEFAEMKFFKRIHIKVSETKSVGFSNMIEAESAYITPDYFVQLAQSVEPGYFSREGFLERFFRVERELGRGGRGVVLLVEHLLDGVSLGRFACKRVPIGDNHAWVDKLLVEVQLLQSLSHQNLVSYRHMWVEDFRLSRFGPSVPCAFILQQYCNGGDLLEYFRERLLGRPARVSDLLGRQPRRLPFDEIYSFSRDITAGVRHLHRNGYIHRDLKPTNCLLHTVGNETRVLVSDFGEVQYRWSDQESINYFAPEVLYQSPPSGPFHNFTTKSDVFSLGMILHFLCFSSLPYQSGGVLDEYGDFEDLDQRREEILSWPGFDDENRLRPDLPDAMYVLLKRLLSVDPDARLTTEQVSYGMGTGRFDNFS